MTHDFKSTLGRLNNSIKEDCDNGEEMLVLVDSYLGQSDIETIRAALELADRMRWRPISEAPKDGTVVRVWDGKNQYDAWMGHDWNIDPESEKEPEWLCGDGDDWAIGYYYTPCKPTHYMPLPKPPATKDN